MSDGPLLPGVRLIMIVSGAQCACRTLSSASHWGIYNSLDLDSPVLPPPCRSARVCDIQPRIGPAARPGPLCAVCAATPFAKEFHPNDNEPKSLPIGIRAACPRLRRAFATEKSPPLVTCGDGSTSPLRPTTRGLSSASRVPKVRVPKLQRSCPKNSSLHRRCGDDGRRLLPSRTHPQCPKLMH